MLTVERITSFLNEEVAPLTLAEDWDNVGLLIGNNEADVSAIMTCLTLTPETAVEAVERRAQLIVSHHPLLFRPVQRLTAETPEGRMILNLIAAGVSVYSPHTSYDSAAAGINVQLAELLELSGVDILRPRCVMDSAPESVNRDRHDSLGAGRFGTLPSALSLRQFIELIKSRLRVKRLQFVGDESAIVEHVAIACGSAAEFLHDAKAKGCQVLLTGEARFHACLEAAAHECVLVLPGHYATERPAMERLAHSLSHKFPQLDVWASESEFDPIKWA